MEKKKIRLSILSIIRWLLLLSIFIGIGKFLYSIIVENISLQTILINESPIRVELILLAFITYLLTLIPDYFEKQSKIILPDVLKTIIIVFIYFSLYFSAKFNLYYNSFWWDDLLHLLASIIIGLIGFLLIYKLNYRYSLNLNPLLLAIFVLTFAISAGVIWEFIEFTSDAFLGSDHQKWSLSSSAILIGKSYQGSGLRDTMSDLIITCLGAFLVSIGVYWTWTRRKNKILRELRKTIQK